MRSICPICGKVVFVSFVAALASSQTHYHEHCRKDPAACIAVLAGEQHPHGEERSISVTARPAFTGVSSATATGSISLQQIGDRWFFDPS